MSQLEVLQQERFVSVSDTHPDFSSPMKDDMDSAEKAPTAFKTISEVADMLGLPQHVLRFWESKFKQIKPLKLRGGRRYYRPDDIEIISTIKHLLYNEGYTINGAKRAFEQARKTRKLVQEPAATQAALTAAIQLSAEALPQEINIPAAASAIQKPVGFAQASDAATKQTTSVLRQYTGALPPIEDSHPDVPRADASTVSAAPAVNATPVMARPIATPAQPVQPLIRATEASSSPVKPAATAAQPGSSAKRTSLESLRDELLELRSSLRALRSAQVA